MRRFSSAPSTLTARNFGLKELLNITALKLPFVQHAHRHDPFLHQRQSGRFGARALSAAQLKA